MPVKHLTPMILLYMSDGLLATDNLKSFSVSTVFDLNDSLTNGISNLFKISTFSRLDLKPLFGK